MILLVLQILLLECWEHLGILHQNVLLQGRLHCSLMSSVFGVVVLELITGRCPIQKAPNKTNESLVTWVSFLNTLHRISLYRRKKGPCYQVEI